jgi:hypothetical protein
MAAALPALKRMHTTVRSYVHGTWMNKKEMFGKNAGGFKKPHR